MAFVASAFWSVAALLAFLRAVQGGLMWRQTGPIIISMSYMILDVLVFLFIFVIVYISFTLSMVHVYNVYSKVGESIILLLQPPGELFSPKPEENRVT